MDRTGKQKITREVAIERLGELAKAPVNDAVRLAFLETGEEIQSLDLTGLAEFRRSEKGVVEIRLVDRAAIWRDLAVLTDARAGEKAEEFFKALRE